MEVWLNWIFAHIRGARHERDLNIVTAMAMYCTVGVTTCHIREVQAAPYVVILRATELVKEVIIY